MIKKKKTSPKGRRCKHPRCGHVLSIYNREDYCHIHSGLLSQEQRTRTKDGR